MSKVTFDLDRLNDNGLVGPPGGLCSLMYEFCIPSDSASARDVAAIENLSSLDYVARIDESFAE